MRRVSNLGLSLVFLALAAQACGEEEKSPIAPGAGGTGGNGGSSGGKSKSSKSSKSGGGDAGDNGSGAEAGQDSGSGGKSGKGGKASGGNAGEDTGSGGDGASAADGGMSSGGTGAVDPFAHCEAFWSEPPEPSETCDLDALEDSGFTLPSEIDADLTLESGQTYNLDGPTRIHPGVTLTIEPCVKVLGQSPTSVLLVMAGDDGDGDPLTNGAPGPGGKLEAVGHEMEPIIFTSSLAPGERRPGDWGGVIVLGNAQVSNATADIRPAIEGLVQGEYYGWHTDAYNEESSGRLSYVRIEFVGREISLDNETNGLTLGGVGSGTQLDHIMVSNSIDDCFEWFGGTVNADHLIADACDDDMFDNDQGFSGTIQFAFGRQNGFSGEADPNGFEFDGQNPTGATPLDSAPHWSNVTLCGTPDPQSSSQRYGMVLRRGFAGSITNTLVTQFPTAGISHRDAGAVTVTYTSAFDNAVPNDEAASPLSWFTDQEGNSIDAPDRFCDCQANPPVPVAAERVSGGEPSGFPDENADYQGAFEDANPDSNWMVGAWVDWSNE